MSQASMAVTASQMGLIGCQCFLHEISLKLIQTTIVDGCHCHCGVHFSMKPISITHSTLLVNEHYLT